jgi:hypothetical protein
MRLWTPIDMANLDQPRSARACYECNRKKTKCNMERPICGLCQRTGMRCEFPTKRRAPSIRKSQGKTNSQKINENLGKLLQLLDATSAYDQELEPRRGSSLRSEDQGSPSFSAGMYQSETQQTEPNCAPQQNDLSAEIEKAQTIIQPEQACASIQMEDSTSQSPSHAHFHQQDLSQPESGHLLEKSVNEGVSYDLAIHLIHVFFDRIQCWLPLLHKPSFLARYMNQLERGPNSMDNLEVEERLLLSCIFALSARYSDSAEFAGIQPPLREHRFKEMARRLYDDARNLQSASITYLQGCILLSFCYYTSGFSAQGWIVVGVCVRLAYELALSDIDDDYEDDKNSGHDNQMSTGLTVLKKEERRRAWWLVWELDTFGSTVSKRPYAIDRRRMQVMLPISDDAWFSGTVAQSSKMDTRPGESWKSLMGSENRDARAWFLVANHLMACTHEHMQRTRETNENDKLILENEVSCFKLSLPSQMQLGSAKFCAEAESSAQYNWIIGIHLMLSVTSFMLSSPLFKSKASSIPISLRQDVAGATRARILEISSIAALWPAPLIETAHPFFACMLLPVHNGSKESTDPAISLSNRDLVSLILAVFARNWELGSCALRKSQDRS